MSLNKVWETKALATYPNNADAKKILDRLAAAVAPVMNRRKWKVPILKEFFPSNPNLLGLNVNRGQSILVRLRPASDKNSFYDWEHCLGTMIHELTHIQISPHDASFYRLMDELDAEIQKDLSQGLVNLSAADHFSGTGHKLGGTGISAGAGMSKEMRAKAAAEATLKRLNMTKLSAGSGSRLGGSQPEVLTKEELRKRAADAALRRMRDDTECGSNWQSHSADHPPLNGGKASSTSSSKVDASATGSIATTSRGSSSAAVNTTVSSRAPNWQCSLCRTSCADTMDCCTFCFSYRYDVVDVSGTGADQDAVVNTIPGADISNDSEYCGPCAPKSAAIAPLSTSSSHVIIDLVGSDSDMDVAAIVDFDENEPNAVTNGPSQCSQWTCSVCTYDNASTNECLVCETPRQPIAVSETNRSTHHSNSSVYHSSRDQSPPTKRSAVRPTEPYRSDSSTVMSSSDVNVPQSNLLVVVCSACTFVNEIVSSGVCAICSSPLPTPERPVEPTRLKGTGGFDPYKPFFGGGGRIT